MRKLMRRAMSALVAISMVAGNAASAGAFSLADGKYYFRCRAPLDISHATPPDTKEKEVVACYIGGIVPADRFEYLMFARGV